MSRARRSRVPRKGSHELEAMREAGRILAQALELTAQAIGPGVTTRELDNLVRRFLAQPGVSASFLGYRGYPAALCVEVEDVVVHGIPGEQRLAEGQIVGLDLGVCYRGLHADAAITCAVGAVDGERERLMQVTQQALAAGIAQAQAGSRLGEIAAAVQGVAEAAGFTVVRDLVGHGIGRQVHEPPQVPNFVAPGVFADCELVLRPGMTLAIEPMVNAGTPAVRMDADGWTVRTADGRPSAHFEHTVAITRTGPEILTRP